MKICIIMPAYNEEKRIENTLSSYSKYFEGLRRQNNLDYEILVVINGTTDRTAEIVRILSKRNKRVLFLNLKRGGKGYAVLEGFKDALKRKNELIGFVDSDMATSPEAFYDLVKNSKNADGVIANRYSRYSKINPKPSISRIFVSRLYNFLIRSLFLIPYRDTQCGAKIFKRKAIESIVNSIGMTKWAFDLELIYSLRKKGFKIIDIPTTWSDKEYSKINFISSGPWMVLAILRFRIINSPFRIFIKIYDKFISYVPK